MSLIILWFLPVNAFVFYLTVLNKKISPFHQACSGSPVNNKCLKHGSSFPLSIHQRCQLFPTCTISTAILFCFFLRDFASFLIFSCVSTCCCGDVFSLFHQSAWPEKSSVLRHCARFQCKKGRSRLQWSSCRWCKVMQNLQDSCSVPLSCGFSHRL